MACFNLFKYFDNDYEKICKEMIRLFESNEYTFENLYDRIRDDTIEYYKFITKNSNNEKYNNILYLYLKNFMNILNLQLEKSHSRYYFEYNNSSINHVIELFHHVLVNNVFQTNVSYTQQCDIVFDHLQNCNIKKYKSCDNDLFSIEIKFKVDDNNKCVKTSETIYYKLDKHVIYMKLSCYETTGFNHKLIYNSIDNDGEDCDYNKRTIVFKNKINEENGYQELDNTKNK